MSRGAWLIAVALISVPPILPVRAQIVINEVDVDTPSADDAEFIELFGSPGASLNGYLLALYNGSTDSCYDIFDLDGYSLDENGFFVLCGDATNVANCDWDVAPDVGLLQNGPDAVALHLGDSTDLWPDYPTCPVTTFQLVDALVYVTNDPSDPGLLVLLNLDQSEVDEGAVSEDREVVSMSRYPDGGTPRNTGTYTLQVPTPGLANTPSILINANVLLEGAYLGSGMMSLALNASIPFAQPFSDSVFDGTPLEYDSVVSAVDVPPDVIDWVLVSVRSSNAPETGVFEAPAFLKDDGTVTGIDGDGLVLQVAPGSYYLVVRHRNHLSVMSSTAVDATAAHLDWDFRTNLGNAFTSGGAAMKSLGDGNFGMFTCDANADGFITAPDFNLWNTSTTAGETGYLQADCDLDGNVTAPDFNLWNANTTAGAASQVPD